MSNQESQPPEVPSTQASPPTSAPTTSTKAVTGLVLAIVSWILCPIILAIVALVVARSSSSEIAASGGRIGGAGLNTATRIIAWINIGIFIVVGIVVAGIAIFGGIFAASIAPPRVDPQINSETGLPDGAHRMEPVVLVVSTGDECTYTGTVYPPDNPADLNAPEVSVYGKGATECPDAEGVDVVNFEVVGGVARIISVQ